MQRLSYLKVQQIWFYKKINSVSLSISHFLSSSIPLGWHNLIRFSSINKKSYCSVELSHWRQTSSGKRGLTFYDVPEHSANLYQEVFNQHLSLKMCSKCFCAVMSCIKYFIKCPMLSVPKVPSTDRNALNSLWGKLASEILMQNWEAAMEDLTRLRETIDNNVNAPLLRIWYLI